MITILMIMAITLMVIGHVFKVKRWGLYISVYENSNYGNLLEALSVGHAVNALFPVRIGDIFRVVIAGKKLKNGYAFSIATVLTDLYVDLLTVGAMFWGLSVLGKGGTYLREVAYTYQIIFLFIIPLTFLAVVFRKYLKRCIATFSSIFNERIELWLLYTSYLSIASLKDIIKIINKTKFVIDTILMWSCYVLSYMFFAEVIQENGYYWSTSDVFATLFATGGVLRIISKATPMWLVFLLMPLLVCLLISIIMRRNQEKNVRRFILPQMNAADRLAFLRTYYSEENRNHIKSYLEINSDVSIVKDNSAGSNASTVLILKNERFYFRKYAFDADGKKLTEQIEWIEEHQSCIPLPIIVDKRIEENFSTYDMHSYATAVGLFKYIHTMPSYQGWKVLENALNDIKNGLHSKNKRISSTDTIEKYIESKVIKNLQIIKSHDKYIAALEKYDQIIVNGVPLKTLKHYQEMLDKKHLSNVFKNDTYSDIHGDLTVENIICISSQDEINADEYEGKFLPTNYYFIDPNTGNMHDSPFLDYAKLLQSLHGNYEFLMMVKNVSVNKNIVNYMLTKSEAYGIVYHEYKKYLKNNFSNESVLSIYYHEIIHWLRLMPYKIRKDEKLAVVFYTGLLQVIADVWEMEHEK